jgi:hypothetical protein
MFAVRISALATVLGVIAVVLRTRRVASRELST